MSTEVSNKIRQCIAQNETQSAIDILLELAKQPAYSSFRDVITAQSAAFNNYQTETIKGLVSPEEQSRMLARIHDGLLRVAQQIEKDPTEIAKEARLSAVSTLLQKRGWMFGLILVAVLIAFLLVRNNLFTASGPFDVKVLIHGKGGLDDLILRNQGTVYLDIPGDRREAPIDGRGLASFEQIPTEYAGRQVRIMIQHPQPYKSIHPDSLFTLVPDAMYQVEARLFLTDTIFGRIYDFNSEQPIDSVRVNVHQMETFTNKYGEFKLGIPEIYQAKFQRVTFMRDGYSTEVLDSIPVHTQQEIVMPMHRRRK